MEILELKSTIAKMKNSLEWLSKLHQAGKKSVNLELGQPVLKEEMEEKWIELQRFVGHHQP